MKTETIRDKTVVRVGNTPGKCVISGSPILCAFFHEECFGGSDGPPCKEAPVIFIRPNQLNDYLAIKLVS